MLNLTPAYVVYVHHFLFISDSLTGRQSQETLVAVSQTEAATADEDSEVNQILTKQRSLHKFSLSGHVAEWVTCLATGKGVVR